MGEYFWDRAPSQYWCLHAGSYIGRTCLPLLPPAHGSSLLSPPALQSHLLLLMDWASSSLPFPASLQETGEILPYSSRIGLDLGLGDRKWVAALKAGPCGCLWHLPQSFPRVGFYS